jgi:hypothetical protein
MSARRSRAAPGHNNWTASVWLEHDLFRKPVSTFRDHALFAAMLEFEADKPRQQRRRIKLADHGFLLTA